MQKYFLSLSDYEYWANAQVLTAWQNEKPSERVVSLCAHLLAAQAIWLHRLESRQIPVPEVWPRYEPNDWMAILKSQHQELQHYIQSIKDWQQEIRYQNTAGHSFAQTPAEILTHLFLHGSYHRGQLVQQLTAQGVSPPITDYIFYLRAHIPTSFTHAGS